MSFGTFTLDGHVPDFDATVVSRALAEGAVIVGKNVMNGLGGGLGFGGAVGDYGRPLNPHAPERLSGGSSSGSAVAVALGEADIAYGGDQGGSIRIPASWCGIVGLKPTFGLVSHFGAGFGADQSIDYVGPMARTVEETARGLQAVAGRDPLDPRQNAEIPEEYDALTDLDDGVDGLRIGLLEEGFAGASDEVRESVFEAIGALESRGAKAAWVSVPEHLQVGRIQDALNAEGSYGILRTQFFGMWAKTYYPATTIAAVGEVMEKQRSQMEPRTVVRHIAAAFARRYWGGRLYAKAQNVRPAIVGAYDRVLEDVDVIAMPTTVTTAPVYARPATRDERLELGILWSKASRSTANTQPFDYTGHPALAVPTGKRGGLPVSMQLVGRYLDDALLLRVAQAYAGAVDFADNIRVSGAADLEEVVA